MTPRPLLPIVLALAADLAHAGGLPSPCAEVETRTVAGIIEDVLVNVEDCARVGMAPLASPRPVPRPDMLGLVPPALPLAPILAAVRGPGIIGGGITPPALYPRPTGGPGGGGDGIPGGGVVVVPGGPGSPGAPDAPVVPLLPPVEEPEGPEETPTPVPVPGAAWMMLMALGALRMVRRRG